MDSALLRNQLERKIVELSRTAGVAITYYWVPDGRLKICVYSAMSGNEVSFVGNEDAVDKCIEFVHARTPQMLKPGSATKEPWSIY